jgi:enamine deaminase RidA (YjgF/YER057c/UK114 family)
MTQTHRSLENPDAVHPPVGRYSHLARFKASETLVLAGQVAIDLEGRLVGEGDLAAQTRQVFDNIGRILEGAGASFDNVVEFTTYVVGRDWRARSRPPRRRPHAGMRSPRSSVDHEVNR